MAIIRCLRFVVTGETAALVSADVVYQYFPQMRTCVCNMYEISLGFSCMCSFCVMCDYLFCVLTVVAVFASFG
jgi:hypothetical protein